jgi:3-oxoacyl-[acyl-carrier protein] reductase
MDLGIQGRKAIVCASSRGLGKACATALAREGCSVVINGLDPERLERAATEIREATGAKVTPMRADINTDAGRAALIAACSDADILVNNNAGPPPGRFDDWKRADWQAAIDANMLAPIFMIQALADARSTRRSHAECLGSHLRRGRTGRVFPHRIRPELSGQTGAHHRPLPRRR